MSDASTDQLHAEVRRLKVELNAVHAENELLRQKLDVMARRLFGKRSEQLSENQLQLLFQELLAPGPAEGKDPAQSPSTSRAPSAVTAKAK